jgi:flagellar biosynthesis protein FlhB
MEEAGQKTERPTHKRLQDARKRGQVSRSQDLSSSLLLLAAVAVFWWVGPRMGAWLTESMRDSIVRAASFKGQLDVPTALASIQSGAAVMGLVLLPLCGVLLLLAGLSGYLQVGSIFAAEAVKPDFKRLDPARGFQQKFLKARPYLELLKTLVKMAVTAAVLLAVLYTARADIIELTHQPAPRVASFTLALIFEIGLKVGLAFLLLGIGDFFLQRALHLRELMMSKREVEKEMKETEGDPLQKSWRLQFFRDLISQNLVVAVKEADVLVVNPTHVAVALKYEPGTKSTPVVVAKGTERTAARMRELAREADVPLVRDVPLARALYELEVNQEIPEELFRAVAEVLKYVYKLAEERGEVR